jgi:hypothetical protein
MISGRAVMHARRSDSTTHIVVLFKKGSPSWSSLPLMETFDPTTASCTAEIVFLGSQNDNGCRNFHHQMLASAGGDIDRAPILRGVAILRGFCLILQLPPHVFLTSFQVNPPVGIHPSFLTRLSFSGYYHYGFIST